MISRAIALAVAGLAAGSAQAQTIVTRSGEHDRFTRLVMRVPDQVNWSVTQNGRMAIVNLGSDSAVFDTDRVFDLIPRTRVQNVRQDGPGQPLRIDLGCDCIVEHFQQADGFLVIDVRDGNGDPLPFNLTQNPLPLIFPRGTSAFRFPLQSIDTGRSQVESAVGQALATGTAEQAISLSLSPGLADRVREAEQAEERRAKAEADSLVQKAKEAADAAISIDLADEQRAALVNGTEARLLQQIDRASDQGLIQLEGDTDQSQILDPLGNGERLEGLPNVSVPSAVDRETGLLAMRRKQDREELLCIRNSRVAVYNWKGEGSFDAQIGALRNKLLGEFDKIYKDAVLNLAKTYLHFGFGAEAVSTLHLLPEGKIKPEKRETLIAIAHILDGVPMPVNNVFTGQQSCESDVAFWAALASGSIKSNANTDAIQQSFAKLPPHLRVHLGPRMSTLFAEAGNPHVAKVTLRSVDRTGAETVPDLNLAEAAIADLEGKPEEVAVFLTEEVAERTRNAPTALIDLIDLSVKERRALSPDVPDLTASYELENRETELGRDLRRVEVAALALVGRFDEAFEQFQALDDRDGPGARKSASGALFTLLTENADDLTFLKYGLAFANDATQSEAAELADILSRRLLDLGFHQASSVLLSKAPLDEQNSDRRMMHAEIALRREQPQKALVELMGLKGKQADRLRAQALWLNEEYERAAEYLLESEDQNGAARGFWYSADLEAAEKLDRDAAPFGEVAELTIGIDEAAQAPEGLTPLAEARSLVDSSMSARTDIERLLGQVTRSEEE